MLSIRVAEVDVIRVGLEISGNSSLEYIASKKSTTEKNVFIKSAQLKSVIILQGFQTKKTTNLELKLLCRHCKNLQPNE